MLTVAQVVLCIEKLAPPSMALPEDPIGLACGSLDWPADRIMLALDACEDTVRQAGEAKAGLLLTHHPLIFRPLSRVDVQTPVGRAIAASLEYRVAVYSAHTNLDSAPRGINSDLAELVGIKDPEPLVPVREDRLKIVVYVPPEAVETVREALFEEGAGRVGAYSQVSFSSLGQGTFLGDEGAHPAAGVAGRLERVDEFRLETVADRRDVQGIVSAARKAHPYEEPVVDVYSLLPSVQRYGLGLVGDLPAAVSVEDLASRLAAALGCGCTRVVGDASRLARRVAVCAGSGSGVLREAVAAGADLLVTGDMKYHDARDAESAGIVVLDVGHFAPERMGMKLFGSRFETHLRENGYNAAVLMAEERDPFVAIGDGHRPR